MRKSRIIIATALLFLSSMAVRAQDTDKYKEMVNKAREYAKEEEYDKVRAAYELAMKLDPDNPEAYISMAKLYYDLKRYEDAQELTDQVLKVDPVSADGWKLQCLIDLELGDLEKLEEDLVFAEVSGADLGSYYQEIGEAYEMAGEAEKAAAYFQAVPANQTGIRNEKLDAVFSQGEVRLIETTPGGITIDPADYGAKFVSISPEGNCALLWNQEENKAYAVYEDQVSLIAPSKDRGAEDTYGKREMMFQEGLLGRFIDSCGVVWSHSGRYASICSYRMSVTMMKYYDPLIIDLSTGEAFLIQATPMFMEPGAATALASCFSSDDRYLYFCQYGSAQEHMYSILRYDFETEEIIVCCSSDEISCRPPMYEDKDGAILFMNDPVRISEERGIIRLSFKDGNNIADFFGSGLPMDGSASLPRDFEYSVNSGYGLNRLISAGYGADGYQICFKCFSVNKDFEGYDRLLAIPADGGKIAELDKMELDTKQIFERLRSYYTVMLLKMSPDGYYALAYGKTLEEDSEELFLIRLEDLTCHEVQGIDPKSIMYQKADAEPVIEWNTDELLFQTKEGIKVYTFQ